MKLRYPWHRGHTGYLHPSSEPTRHSTVHPTTIAGGTWIDPSGHPCSSCQPPASAKSATAKAGAPKTMTMPASQMSTIGTGIRSGVAAVTAAAACPAGCWSGVSVSRRHPQLHSSRSRRSRHSRQCPHCGHSRLVTRTVANRRAKRLPTKMNPATAAQPLCGAPSGIARNASIGSPMSQIAATRHPVLGLAGGWSAITAASPALPLSAYAYPPTGSRGITLKRTRALRPCDQSSIRPPSDRLDRYPTGNANLISAPG